MILSAVIALAWSLALSIALAFLALPVAKQTAMRKLHDDLQRLPPLDRQRLTNLLGRYAGWLDKLPEAERQAVANAPDKRARLQSAARLAELGLRLMDLADRRRDTRVGHGLSRRPHDRPPRLSAAAGSQLGDDRLW
jgi:hypothetical protein